MATFRKYGGTNFSPIANIVRHNILNSKSSSITTSGLYNSKETFLSHIDMSGNSLLHVGNLSFQDGTSISSGTIVNPGLTQVSTNNENAGEIINGIFEYNWSTMKSVNYLNNVLGNFTINIINLPSIYDNISYTITLIINNNFYATIVTIENNQQNIYYNIEQSTIPNSTIIVQTFTLIYVNSHVKILSSVTPYVN
jgi:hypothetical protein